MSYHISNLEIGGIELKFYSPIQKVLITGDKVLVLLERVGVEVDETKESLTQNIHAYGNKGRKLWSIEPPPTFQNRKGLITGLYTRENKVLAYMSYGVDFEINLDDGSLIHIPDQRPW